MLSTGDHTGPKKEDTIESKSEILRDGKERNFKYIPELPPSN